MKPLTISVVTCSYNTPLDVWERCLEALYKQSYPIIEHIVMDAGSSNGAIELAKKYGSRVFVQKSLLHYSQKRMSLGIARSKGDIVLFLEPDNIIPSKDWLLRMTEPFQDMSIIGTYSMYNTYTPRMSRLSQYFSLIGSNEPLLLYLKKSEKNLIYQKHYHKGEIQYENERYVASKFRPDTLPTLGDNGHMVRRRIINKVNTDPDLFVHVDAFYELAKRGYSTYGVVKNAIIHDNSQSNDIIKALRRRVSYKEKFYNLSSVKRKYLVFDATRPSDVFHLMMFIIAGITVVPNLIFSIIGYFRHKNIAWFYHPIVCWLETIMYAFSEIRMVIYNTNYE